jgi:acyl-CoA thioesterase I
LRFNLKYLSIALLLFVSCDNPTNIADIQSGIEVLPAIDIPWTNEQSLVCFGTSLTYGFMWEWYHPPVGPVSLKSQPLPRISNINSIDTTSYPALLARTLTITVYNQGYVGATTEKGLEIVGDSVFTKNPAVVLLEFGADDFLQQTNVQVVEQRLGRLIDTLNLIGSKVILISFLYPEMIRSVPSTYFLASHKDTALAYLNMLRRVADNHNILFVEDAMEGIYWNADLMSDVIHPNKNGYRRMQENISRALVNTFQKNGMLK